LQEQPQATKKASPEEMRAQGFVPYRGDWVKKEDLPFLQKGLVKYEDQWVTKTDMEKMKKGLVKHAGTWISKEDLANIEKGLFKVKGEWVDKAAANKFHGEWDDAWEIESDHFVLRTDMDYDFAAKMSQAAEKLFANMTTFLGFEPELRDPLPVYIFKDLDEYNVFGSQYANGDEGFRSSAMGCFYALSHPDAPAVTFYHFDENYNYLWTDQWFHHVVPHQILAEALPNLASTWMLNGIATYFELWSNFEPPFKEIKRKLSGRRMIPLNDFFDIEGLSDNDEGGFNLSTDSNHATQAGFLIYFMVHNEKYNKLLKEYFSKMTKSANDMKTFAKTFKISELEKDFKEYVASL
jgi:hypothetical protein